MEAGEARRLPVNCFILPSLDRRAAGRPMAACCGCGLAFSTSHNDGLTNTRMVTTGRRAYWS